MSDRSAVRRIMSSGLRAVMPTITHVATREPVAALTFDDGPHGDYTPRLLEILARHRAAATFFVVGEAARRHPDIVRQVAAAGHALGNHGWDHTSLVTVDGWERRRQIRACAEAIGASGQRLFRPPFGHQSVASRLDLLYLCYRVIAWNLDPADWLEHDSVEMASWLVERIRPGSVVLLHDAIHRPRRGAVVDRTQTLRVVDRVLERLRGEMRFVTVPELLRRGTPQRANWFQRAEIGSR
jgi:peptidoglycan/xylan/chitin deacetylase (PgdA/CDA1 family)